MTYFYRSPLSCFSIDNEVIRNGAIGRESRTSKPSTTTTFRRRSVTPKERASPTRNTTIRVSACVPVKCRPSSASKSLLPTSNARVFLDLEKQSPQRMSWAPDAVDFLWICLNSKQLLLPLQATRCAGRKAYSSRA